MTGPRWQRVEVTSWLPLLPSLRLQLGLADSGVGDLLPRFRDVWLHMSRIILGSTCGFQLLNIMLAQLGGL